MENFVYDIPTQVIFGKDILDQLPKYLKKNKASRILLAYGRGSIKKNGVYDGVVLQLQKEGLYFRELSGIRANPDVSSVRQGVDLVREENLDFILAMGGGSTIDCAKAIAAASQFDEDPWKLIIEKPYIADPLPIGAILTIAATGSEMNGNAVISNRETREKISISQPNLCPKFAFEDPEVTYTLPPLQTASGATDIFIHLLEQYFDSHEEVSVTDRMIEGVMKSVMDNTAKALEDPHCFEARANLMWSSSLALNRLFFCGKKYGGDWASHAIEHEISAIYDIPHGVGLAIVTPHLLRFFLQKDLEEKQPLTKFVQLAQRVFDVEGSDPERVAREGINRLEQWLKSIHMPTTLAEVDIDGEKIPEMAEKALKYRKIGKYYPLTSRDVALVLEDCL